MTAPARSLLLEFWRATCRRTTLAIAVVAVGAPAYWVSARRVTI